MAKILLTGGSGLLGSELRKLDSSLIAPTSTELDITDPVSIEQAFSLYAPDILIHAAAKTKPPEHEQNPEIGITHNIIGTANIARACLKQGIRLVYTSSDYVYKGKGPHKEDESVYAPSKFVYSKIGGECAVSVVPDSLILRLSFGPIPFPWEKVYADQYNSKLYVDEIAPLILAAATSSTVGVLNIGGPRTSLEAYARRSRSDIETIPRPDWVPPDTSLDLSRMQEVLGISDLETVLKR